MRCTLIKGIIGMYFHICNWFQLIEPNSSKSKEFCLNYILKSKFYTSAYDTVYINMYYFTHTCTTQVSKTIWLIRRHLNQSYILKFTCTYPKTLVNIHGIWICLWGFCILYIDPEVTLDNFYLKINVLRHCKRIDFTCSRWIVHVVFAVGLILLSSCNYINSRSIYVRSCLGRHPWY